MNITAETVSVSQSTGTLTYAAILHVDFGTETWHGLEWRRGAISDKPLTRPAGAMSTPLVPLSRSFICLAEAGVAGAIMYWLLRALGRLR